MKVTIHYFICVIILFFCGQLKAQEKDYITISFSLITEKPIEQMQGESKQNLAINNHQVKIDELTPKGTNEIIPSYFRSHKELPKKFSGYAIELVQSEIPLAKNYHLFERFGNVNVQQLNNGNYSYCIILNHFKKLDRVKNFAKEVVLPLVPKANIIRFRKGNRKKM